ncbi:hypothetical protein KVT40_008378 [Elsinoe batatas]|uniref:glutathione transferase n=1 Tax=Elsinoe batatas TaxID=2601811 RepID=A0A8K0PCC4_9PEZI|nr:hypothetical protein KVT40_008378 [Elsinoe batatas]
MAPPITIYGMLQSTCTQRVLLTCLELNIPYTLSEFGRVPALQDGDLHLFESRLAKYAEASSVEYSYFDPAMKTLAFEKLFKGFMGKGPADEGVVAASTETLVKALQKWLGGDEFSLLEVYHAPWVAFLERLGLNGELEKRGNVKAWWERVKGRESWGKLQAVVGGH